MVGSVVKRPKRTFRVPIGAAESARNALPP